MEIRLLSVEEAEMIPRDILTCKAPKNFDGYVDSINCCPWWLQTKSVESDGAVSYITEFGSIDDYGYMSDTEDIAIRPILKLDKALLKKMPKTKRGYIKYLNTKWIDVSDYVGYPCLLKKKCLVKAYPFDKKSDNYNESIIKEYIEGWYNNMLEKYGN